MLTVPAHAQNTPEETKAKSGFGAGIERFHAYLSKTVKMTAYGVDKFFNEQTTYDWQDNYSSVSVRFDSDYIDPSGWEHAPKLRLHIVLPGLNGRLRLVANDEIDDDANSVGDFTDESSVALRFLGREDGAFQPSFDLGLRVRDSELDPYGRVNLFVNYGLGQHWGARSGGRFFYYSETGGRVDLRHYFERKLSDNFMFRSMTRLQWFEEHSGVYPEQRFSIYQKLDPKSAIVYEAIAEARPADDTPFDPQDITEPDDRYTHYFVRARYRRNMFWPWLFVELWPTVGWAEERDYEFTWGGRIRLEAVFGHIAAGQRTKIE